MNKGIAEKLNRARISYNYCGVCGRTPGEQEEPNHAPLRWWDADDGWKIGTLCRWCAEDVLRDKPKKGDFAFNDTNGICDDESTDEDPSLALA